MENISKEQVISIFLFGDFKINLLHYNEHNQIYEYLDSLASNSFLLLILQTNRITSHYNTFIDKNASNAIDSDIISGNLTAIIFDHLPPFALIPNIFDNISDNKSNVYERDWLKLDPKMFFLDNLSVDW